MNYINFYMSPIGNITLASDGQYLTGLWFDRQKYDRRKLSDKKIRKELEIFDLTKKWLDIYFTSKEPDFLPQIKIEESDFGTMVLETLLELKFGQTTSYGEISKIIAKKKNIKSMSAQAVGSAIGKNPISIIIPCHRVLSKDKKLTGYAGGLYRKKFLLENENISI